MTTSVIIAHKAAPDHASAIANGPFIAQVVGIVVVALCLIKVVCKPYSVVFAQAALSIDESCCLSSIKSGPAPNPGGAAAPHLAVRTGFAVVSLSPSLPHTAQK